MTFQESLDADLDDLFFTDGELCQKITFVSSNGVEQEIDAAVFDSEDELVEGTLVMIWCKVSDVPNLTKGDIFRWNGVPMDVVDFRPDEFGHVMKIFINKEKD